MEKKLDILLSYIGCRLKERSTYVGLIAIVTGFGYHLTAVEVNLIISTGVGIGGLVAALWPDSDPAKTCSKCVNNVCSKCNDL